MGGLMDKNKTRNDMNAEKVIDLLWEVKEGKKHPNKAYTELCVLFDVSGRFYSDEEIRKMKYLSFCQGLVDNDSGDE